MTRCNMQHVTERCTGQKEARGRTGGQGREEGETQSQIQIQNQNQTQSYWKPNQTPAISHKSPSYSIMGVPRAHTLTHTH